MTKFLVVHSSCGGRWIVSSVAASLKLKTTPRLIATKSMVDLCKHVESTMMTMKCITDVQR